MKKVSLAINVFAFAMLALIFVEGSLTNDLQVRIELTELDRAGGIHEANFSKHYQGRHLSPRDQTFSHLLARPWIEQWYAAILIGAFLAIANIALAVRKTAPEAERKA